MATKYPIGAPVLTALVMAILPGKASTEHDWLAARIVVILAGVVFVVASRQLFELTGLSPWSSTLLGMAIAWFPWMFHLTATLMSDVPYAAICAVLAVRWIRRSRSGPVDAREWMIDGILVGLGWLIRANGITLVVAAVVAALQARSRWSRVGAVLIGIACLKIPASLYVYSLSGPRDTSSYFTEQIAAYEAASRLWTLPLKNVARLPRLLLATVFPPSEWTAHVIAVFSRWIVLRWIGSSCVIGLLVCGMIRLFHRKIWPASIWIHAGLTLTIYLFWYYPIDHRFALPLIPFVLAACAIGMKVIVKRRSMIPVFCAIPLGGSLLVVLGMLWRAQAHGGYARGDRAIETSVLFKIISSETPRDAVIICPVPEFMYLNTGRRAVPLKDDVLVVGSKPVSLIRLQYWMLLADNQPLYLLTDNLNGANERDILKFCSDGLLHLKPVCSTPDGHLWLVERSASYH